MNLRGPIQEHDMSPSRRTFLKTVGAAGAGVIVTGSVLAETRALVPKRKFGRHKEMVSSLGIGGHTLAKAITLEEATRIAHEAIDLGVTFFDNAWEYHNGRGEEWMGKALEGKRDKVFLMTKVCTHREGQQSKEKAMAMLDVSLQRLKTDHHPRSAQVRAGARKANSYQYKLRRPHALPTFTQLACLLQIALDFARLACGLASPQPASSDLPNSKEAEPALHRSYGNL